MDIYEYLKKDHNKVAKLFEKIAGEANATTRQSYFDQIKNELTLHAKTEEATFYEALKKGDEEVQEKEEHAEEEHDEMEKLIKKVSGFESNTVEWLMACGELKHCVDHHVEEEEGEIFKMAKKVISREEAVELAAEMDAMKQDMLKKGKAA